ncbi:hypothetical protein OOK36_55555 [Streptomyces sp. NBC_00365]|uniref:hypothetical protein n=1 Tax=Streptomyces sp. NBC_00365 TaxID=2975726 RepID=UPI00225ABDC9|nr:hypothetical protein [Streptomyces sp. NBC_00365]MCX5096273.1 hypothetical protein [Streptomyces sp. NBC_00365]MCX5097673.1 hypothetical protein [Streptomyces sp. NBC_00365]
MPPTSLPATGMPAVTLVMDPHDDAVHTHAALAAHHPPSGRITLHPGPGTTSDTALAHDLLAALGRPPLLPGRFPSGRQPAWEAATAWVTAQPVTRLTVLRAHRLTARRAERLLYLRAVTGIHLTLVCHRPHLSAALHQALHTVDHAVIADYEAAQHHYADGLLAPADDAVDSARRSSRWITLPALDRLVSYDSPASCRAPCTPPPIIWRHRMPPAPLTTHTAREVARRLAHSTAHPRLAAALAAALFTGASFQQLATAGLRDYDDAAATLALHDRARYTDGCAAHLVPGWARVFLRAAACFARLVPGDDQALLAARGDRTHLLRLAETARLRPPQPPAARRTDRAGRVEWDWREQQEAKKYDVLLGVRGEPSRD